MSRLASGFMTYPGNCVAGIEARIATSEPMGPNYLGEPMWPVDAVYDSKTDTTSVGFSLVAPKAVAS